MTRDEEEGEGDGPAAWAERWDAARRKVIEARASAYALLRRALPSESQRLFAVTLLVGVVCGLVAVAFHLAIRAAEGLLIERALRAPGRGWAFWTVASPTAGGLFAGAALTWLVPGARGSGVPQVKQAFATEGGRVRFRDAVGKFLVGALQIGSGASLGREGPTVQICAGATSLMARATALPPRSMRRLMPVGVAAGIAAAFNAPVAAVTFTIEEVVGTLDQTVLSGVVVAAALAAVIERGILGVHPVIEVKQAYGLEHASSLALFAALGVAAGLVAVGFTDALLALRARFRKLAAIPRWTQPAVGGLVTGVLAVAVFGLLGKTGVTGSGYETLGRALAGELGFRVLVAMGAVKLVATVFSYSSGGAGGIFAPSLFIGAMLGGAVGHLDVWLLHHESRQLGAFALVGMGAVFAGVIRAPITSVLIIFEMTGGYGLVLPLMLSNMTAYLIARRLRPTPIYEALLAQDGVTLPHGAAVTEHGPATAPWKPALVGSLAVRAPCVEGATVETLLAELRGHEAEAFIVRLGRDEFGVVTARQRAELEAVGPALGATATGALVRAALVVTEHEPLAALRKALDSTRADAVVVLEAETKRPVGVVTVAALALALLDAFAAAPHAAGASQPPRGLPATA